MKQENKRKMIWSLLLLALLLVAVIALALRLGKQRRAEDVYGGMRQTMESTAVGEAFEDVVSTEAIDSDQVLNMTRALEDAVYESVPKIDFKELSKTNTDICAWIFVPGTQVDYPVLRNEESEDPHDDYYLLHTVERASGLPGAIYMEPCNEGDFSDANTVLYGHNMKNGTMFGSLHRFLDDTFFAEQEYAYVVTPEKNRIYRIFAAVTYSDTHIMRTFDFEQEPDYTYFLKSLKDNRSMNDLFREETEVSVEDCILTLSTCVKGQDDKRLLIEAVLVDEYERE